MIKRWINEDFQEELFAHTKRLRAKQGSRDQEYRLPLCEGTGKPLSFDILIKCPPNIQSEFADINPLSRSRIAGVRSIEVSSSRISGSGKIDMYQKYGMRDSDPTQMAWMYENSL